MGKKSRKKKPSGMASVGNHPQRVDNPDGSSSMMIIKDESVHIGGHTMYLGHTGMPCSASPYSLDPFANDHQLGKRQLMSLEAMSDAFHRQYKGEEVDPMTEAALSIETKVA